jgi:hypothetical protein
MRPALLPLATALALSGPTLARAGTGTSTRALARSATSPLAAPGRPAPAAADLSAEVEPEAWPDAASYLRQEGLADLALDEAAARATFSLGGFADVSLFADSIQPSVELAVGQLTLHGLADLTRGFGAFVEVTINSMPAWETRVERLLLFREWSDALKVSLGRHHIPVTWWNQTFHHGLWLQTTARRPMMIGYSDAFVPNHAVGLIAEGRVPGAEVIGLRYHAAVTGGGDDHNHGGTNGATVRGGFHLHPDARLAWTGAFSIEPPSVPRLRIGAVVFADPHRVRDDLHVAETAYGAHLAYTAEQPELIAEVVVVRHRLPGSGQVFHSFGAYGQVAWRLPGAAEAWKPYARYERMVIDPDDPTLRASSSQELALAGVRLDLTPWVALKLEGAWRRVEDRPASWEVVSQAGVAW